MLKSENFEYLLDERLRKVYVDVLKEVPTMIPSLFTIAKSSKAVEYDYSMGDAPAIGEFDNKIKYEEIYGQYRTPYEHKEYAGGIQIQRKLIDDEQYNVIDKTPAQLAVSMRRRRESDAAYLFNNAFNTSVTYGDSKALCASDHPTTVTASTTFSNTGTSSLSPANISAARLSMKKINSSTDQIVAIDPDAILIPIDLEETLDIILKTDKKIDSANNDVNFNQGRFKAIVWRYLTDTNNWFMIDSMLMKQYLNWFNRIPVEFERDADSDTMIRKFYTYSRYSCGASEWRWIRGNAV